MFSSFFSRTRSSITEVSPRELEQLPPGTRLIDVREPEEYHRDHLANAELVPLGTLSSTAGPWDRSAPLLLICRSGGRSSRGATELEALGFQNIMNLSGGMNAVRSRS